MSQKNSASCRPEVWGGIECTINRVGDTFYDQLEAAGYYGRETDLDRMAELGIKALRFPILWERHQPNADQPIDWTRTDEQLGQLRERGILPIAGLVHHGSGPAYTDLSSPDFAEGLAAYAGLVAARYPWLDHYTPVNEPLTTARFSGLYGIWYPHHSSALQFMTLLLNQVKGIVLSMKAIRRVNPAARLVQTEDLSFVHSTPALAYQADFENERRWLTYDLLCGKVDKGHPLWDYLLYIGVKASELNFFTDHPCIPDLLGLNYYVTSERYLDEAVERYPATARGGNGKDPYADVDAVRAVKPAGLYQLLEQAWQRYQLPLAITETHINCTREQQLRWLNETWETARDALRSGIDVRAVTFWALLGSYDWDSLLTRREGHYESGAYAVNDGRLRLTAIGALVKKLASEGDCHHPLLDAPGWWHFRNDAPGPSYGTNHPLLIAGSAASCKLWFKICLGRGILCRLVLSQDQSLPERHWQRLIQRYQPWGVIILSDSGTGNRAVLAEICRRRGLPCLLWQASMCGGEGSVQDALDLFIDEVLVTKWVDCRQALSAKIA